MGEGWLGAGKWTMPLYWRVRSINGLVFILGTLALALSPGTVSTRILVSEAVVLMIGLIVTLALHALCRGPACRRSIAR